LDPFIALQQEQNGGRMNQVYRESVKQWECINPEHEEAI